MNKMIALPVLMFCSTLLTGQTTIQLPQPTGIFQIGTYTTELQTQIKDPFSSKANNFIKIPIQFWYPSQTDTLRLLAKYSPLFRETDSILTNSFYNREFSNNFPQAPVVLICIGRGMTKHEYSIASEELASNGYIVASFDLPYIGTTKFLDSNLIRASQQFRLPPGMLSGPYEKVDSFFVTASTLGTKYVNTVLEYIKSENKSVISPIYKKIDLNNIGVFGHSLGGRIAGQVIAENKMVKAYISMEGIAPRETRINGVSKTMAYILSDGIVKTAIENYEQAIPKRKSDIYIIILKGFGHNSFTDYPLIDKPSANYKIDANESIRMTRKILVSYFNQYLKTMESFEKQMTGEASVEIRKYTKQ